MKTFKEYLNESRDEEKPGTSDKKKIEDLTPGDKCVFMYKNNGVKYIECTFLGFTDDTQQYGKGSKISFKTQKELLTHYKVKTLAQLEALQDKNEYGYHSYMILKMVSGQVFNSYVFKGKWTIGSGADKITLV